MSQNSTRTQNLPHLYTAAYLDQLGVTLEEFEAGPMAAMNRLGQYDAIDLILAGRRPLMPAQARLRTELEREWNRSGTEVARRTTTRGVRAGQSTPGARRGARLTGAHPGGWRQCVPPVELARTTDHGIER